MALLRIILKNGKTGVIRRCNPTAESHIWTVIVVLRTKDLIFPWNKLDLFFFIYFFIIVRTAPWKSTNVNFSLETSLWECKHTIVSSGCQ